MATTLKNARPLLSKADNGVWEACETSRDAIYQAFRNAAAKHNIQPLVLRSPAGVFPVWVRFEAWFRRDEPQYTQRFHVTVTLTPMAHRRLPIRLEVAGRDRATNLRANTQMLSIPELASVMGPAVIEDVVACAAGSKARLPVAFRWTWGDAAAGIFKRNPLPLFQMTEGQVAGVVAIVIGQFATIAGSAGAVIGGLLMLCGAMPFAISGLTRLFQRRVLAADSGRPSAPPRDLITMDSWHVLLAGVGHRAGEARQQLASSLADSGDTETGSDLETIGYWSLDTLEERQQIVVARRRALVFCHVYAYGGDLYLGWDSHLNAGEWKERDVHAGFSAREGVSLRATDVFASVARPTDYHVTDLNSLTEWVHSRVTRVAKQLVDEHAIDQEIDFTILRRERESALKSRAERDKAGKRSRGLVSGRFQRAA